MRIVIVTDAWFPQINGVVTTLAHVRDEMLARGHEVIVLHPDLTATIPCPKYPGIRLSVAPWRVRKLLREYAPDAIHIATEGPLGLIARQYCGTQGIPFTTSYHTQFPEYVQRYSGVPAPLTYKGLRWFHGGAAHTLVTTISMKEDLEAKGFNNLVVWTRGVDTSLFKPYDEPLYADLPRPIFLYAGRVAIEKNIEQFLSLDLPGSKVVVGDGPAMPALRKQYTDATFVGFKLGEDLARHYADADVFVFPSRTDTFGVVLIEALACGLPVAAYPVTGPKDIVEDGVSGYLSDDLQDAALRCTKLDPAHCRERARDFTWERCGDIFLETLAIMSPRPPAFVPRPDTDDAPTMHTNGVQTSAEEPNALTAV